MKKILLFSFLGLILLGLSLFLGFFGMQSISSSGNPLILLASMVIFAIGMFVLYKAGRIDAFKSKIASMQAPTTNGKSMLDKNNEILKEWNHTNDQRDKLKMLEAAGRAEEGKTLS